MADSMMSDSTEHLPRANGVSAVYSADLQKQQECLSNGGAKMQQQSVKEDGSPDVSQEWSPPDGGYGWVIVMGSLMMFFIFSSYTQIGIFLLELEKYFDVSKATISWVNAAHTVTGRVCGVCIGQVLAHVGCRWMSGVGIILLSGGYFLGSFVNNVPLLFLTFGFIASIGSGCIYTTASATVQQYFTRRRSLANGFCIVGIPIGSFAWPPFAQYLIQNYGWRNTFRIDSAIMLGLGVIIITVMKPPGNQKSLKLCCERRRTENVAPPEHNKKQSCGLWRFCDLSLLRKPTLVFYWTGMIFMALGHLSNGIYLPVRGEMIGMSPSLAAWQSSVFGILGGIGTPIFAAVGNIPGVDRLVMVVVGTFLASMLTIASTFITSSTLLLVSAGFIGLCGALFTSVLFVIAVDLAGLDKIAVAGGFQTAAYGLAHLILHPTAGWLLDVTDNPQVPFYLASACLLLSCICVSGSLVTRKRLTAHALDLSSPPFKDVTPTVQITVLESKQERKEADKADSGIFITYM